MGGGCACSGRHHIDVSLRVLMILRCKEPEVGTSIRMKARCLSKLLVLGRVMETGSVISETTNKAVPCTDCIDLNTTDVWSMCTCRRLRHCVHKQQPCCKLAFGDSHWFTGHFRSEISRLLLKSALASKCWRWTVNHKGKSPPPQPCSPTGNVTELEIITG